MPRERCDIAIIGAGVMGLATGIALLQNQPSLKIVIADKENEIASHASGRNSGVLHAGFYYSPDSLKARFCRDGNRAIRQLAKKYGIPVREVGKVVVARNSDENQRLDTLLERGLMNGVELELLEESKLSEFEPLAKTHQRFLWSPSTAISDSKAIVKAMYDEFPSHDRDGGLVLKSLKLDTQLLSIIALQFVGFVGFWLSHNMFISLFCLLAVGMGISMQFALSSIRLIGLSDGRPDLAIGRASLAAGTAIAGAPFLLGILGDNFGISRAYIIVS